MYPDRSVGASQRQTVPLLIERDREVRRSVPKNKSGLCRIGTGIPKLRSLPAAAGQQPIACRTQGAGPGRCTLLANDPDLIFIFVHALLEMFPQRRDRDRTRREERGAVVIGCADNPSTVSAPYGAPSCIYPSRPEFLDELDLIGLPHLKSVSLRDQQELAIGRERGGRKRSPS